MSIKKLTFDCIIAINFTEQEVQALTESDMSLSDLVKAIKSQINEAFTYAGEDERKVVFGVHNIETES